MTEATSDGAQFETIEAEFRPRRTDDLHPGVEALIGRRYEFVRLWLIEEGPYIGEWAMGTPNYWPTQATWVPSGDLSQVNAHAD